MSIHLNLPLIRITPHHSMGVSVVIGGYITRASHTHLNVSGVSMKDLIALRQAGIDNKITGNNAFCLDLSSCDYIEVD